MVSGIPHLVGLGTRMWDPCFYVVFWAPIYGPRAWALPFLEGSDVWAHVLF